MPYNIYDNLGNKIGEITSTAEDGAGFAFLLIIAIGIGLVKWVVEWEYAWFTQIYWPWARMAHSLTPYANLNGLITCLAIPMVAFVISARWEKIVRGETNLLGEFCRIAAIVYSAIGIGPLILLLTSIAFSFFHFHVTLQDAYVYCFLIAPVAVSTLTSYLRFRPIRLIIGLLIGIPVGLIGLVIIVWIAWSIINAIGGWLFR